MNEEQLFKRLEGYTTPLPYDFRQQVNNLCAGQGIPQFADPIIHNIEGVRSIGQQEGGELHAGHIVGIILTTIFTMIKQGYSGEHVISAVKVAPAIISAIISNPTARQDALQFYFDRIDEFGKQK